MPAILDTMESITLRLENDAVLSFRGRLFSEAVWNDEESGVFTHQKLYVTDQNEHVYVIRKGGERRLCRAYRVSVRGERWYMVDVKLVRKFDTPLKLSDLKKEPELDGMELLKRGSRLSVQPVEEPFFQHIMKMVK